MKKNISTIGLISIFLLISFILSAQSTEVSFQYISPKPGSNYNLPQCRIALRHGEKIDRTTLNEINIQVLGSKSGIRDGKVKLSVDERTFFFISNRPFVLGETVQVEFSGNLKTINGKSFQPLSYNFFISNRLPELPKDYHEKNEFSSNILLDKEDRNSYSPQNKSVKTNNLPDDFPEFTVELSNNPTLGEYYFVSPFGYWSWFPDNTPYLVIVDEEATPVYYKRLSGHPYDFKIQPNGQLSFYYNLWPNAYIAVYDSSYNQIDSYTMQDGYNTDFHEFILLPNGHAFLQGYDAQFVDMSQIVPGGNPNAVVTGWIIQELDEEKNVVFQWRSWDHYDILDADEHVDLTADSFDPIHGNSIDVVDENTLLLSPRNFNEMSLIDRNTGEFIWRLGGNNNMFEFINDSLRFSRAHDGRILENGNLTLFDNGTYHPEPNYSSTLEYELDETNMTATLINRYRNTPDIFGTIMGSAQHKENGHMIAGWGSGVPGLTEFSEEGEMLLEMYFAGINYRAFQFPWTTNYFALSEDTLHFGYTWYQEPVEKKIKVFNNQEVAINLSSAFVPGNYFTVETEFPIGIEPLGSVWIDLMFSPDAAGFYEDKITFNCDINTEMMVQRIAQQLQVRGNATQGQSITDFMPGLKSIYPNPVEDELILEFNTSEDPINIEVYSSIGQLMNQVKFDHPGKEKIDMKSYPKGIYLLHIKHSKSSQTQSIKIIKK